MDLVSQNQIVKSAANDLYQKCKIDSEFSKWQSKYFSMWVVFLPPAPYDAVWDSFINDYFGVFAVEIKLSYDTKEYTTTGTDNQIAKNIEMYKLKQFADEI